MAENETKEVASEQPKKKNHRKAKIGWSIVGAVILTIAAASTILIITSKMNRYNSSEVKRLSEQTFVCNEAGIKITDKKSEEVTRAEDKALIIAAITRKIADDKNPSELAEAVYHDFVVYTRDIDKFKGTYFTFGSTSWQSFSKIDYTFYTSNGTEVFKDTAESRNGDFDDSTFGVGCKLENIGEIECMRTSYVDFDEEEPSFHLFRGLGEDAGATRISWKVLDNEYVLQYYANYTLKK